MNHLLHRAFFFVATSLLAGCGAKTAGDASIDGQSHWLTACETDATCGTASCMCGVCTGECATDSDCWTQGQEMTSRCAEAEPLGCSAAPRVCVPDCAGDDCISTPSDTSSSETVELSHRLDFRTTEVPSCPELADRVGQPLASVIADESYEGPVTVQSVTDAQGGRRVTLVFNERAGGQATLTLRDELPMPQGARFRALLEADGGNDVEHAFLALWDDDENLVLAVHTGADGLYQAGRFSTKELFGATVELRMQCQDSVDDGCFEDQVQAVYEATFDADNQVTLDGTRNETLSIEGREYSVSFVGRGLDGGANTCNNGLSPGRFIDFALLGPDRR